MWTHEDIEGGVEFQRRYSHVQNNIEGQKQRLQLGKEKEKKKLLQCLNCQSSHVSRISPKSLFFGDLSDSKIGPQPSHPSSAGGQNHHFFWLATGFDSLPPNFLSTGACY